MTAQSELQFRAVDRLNEAVEEIENAFGRLAALDFYSQINSLYTWAGVTKIEEEEADEMINMMNGVYA